MEALKSGKNNIQLTELTDTEIISKVKSGEINSFKELVVMYKDKSFSLIMKILKNRNESEDCLQEVFMKIFNSIMTGSFEEKSKFSTYVYSIVYNTAVDYYKKNKKKNFNIVSIDINDSNYRIGDELTVNFNDSLAEKGLYSSGNEYNPDQKLTQKEISQIIAEYLKNIPEHYSVILNMFYINELSYDEISKILNLPLGTIKNRIFRAKEKLKELLLKRITAEELLDYV
jgi:RNA polymerase sigma-70 factor (ECF subfamily)